MDERVKRLKTLLNWKCHTLSFFAKLGIFFFVCDKEGNQYGVQGVFLDDTLPIKERGIFSFDSMSIVHDLFGWVG